jgi:hypothetical protein
MYLRVKIIYYTLLLASFIIIYITIVAEIQKFAKINNIVHIFFNLAADNLTSM